MTETNYDFMLEKRLRMLNPELHSRFTSALFALQHTLFHYQRLFPEYTDHSELHSMTVIDFCNQLIGAEQIERLNADEIYVLLMSCYLHDVGMGISEKDYHRFKENWDSETYFAEHPDASMADFVREYHHEFSGAFIKKYAELLEIPSEEHVFCIIQVSRGHRRTDLFDETEYPAAFRFANGNTVCLPYLAALIRLADEVDVSAERNPFLLYDMARLTNEVSILHNRMQAAVRRLDITSDRFIMEVDTEDTDLYAPLEKLRNGMQRTLDYCVSVADTRSPYQITQTSIEIKRTGE